jgi:hypothetical protein
MRQEPDDGVPETGRSGAWVVLVPTGLVPLVAAMAPIEQTGESTQETPAAGVERPGVGAMSPIGKLRPVPGATWPSTTAMPQMEVEAPAMAGSWLGMTAMPQEETT